MIIVKCRYKKNVRKKVKDTQKMYTFICPLKNVEVGEYVIVEMHQGKTMGLARIEEILLVKDYKECITGVVFDKIGTKDVEKRSRACLKILYRYMVVNGFLNERDYRNLN